MAIIVTWMFWKKFQSYLNHKTKIPPSKCLWKWHLQNVHMSLTFVLTENGVFEWLRPNFNYKYQMIIQKCPGIQVLMCVFLGVFTDRVTTHRRADGQTLWCMCSYGCLGQIWDLASEGCMDCPEVVRGHNNTVSLEVNYHKDLIHCNPIWSQLVWVIKISK